MNFFEAQATARRHTFLLIILFSLAVASLIGITNLLVMAVMVFKETGHIPSSWDALFVAYDPGRGFAVTLIIILIVAAGSFYKMSMLASGGKVVAEMLGGRVIPQNSTDPVHRKILNVVEEMAIASGSPVPSVYMLDESGINAFAAGWSPNNAAIGITRGAVTYLTRDELQGVIAHEFSHIFNGDMRLNIRLMGILNGILVLGIIGYYLMRSIRYVGRSRDKGGGLVAAVFMLGVGLFVIGYCGTFFGEWIKSIVSRQREYLADASAVQFTRQSGGIAGALKKIGGWQAGSHLLSPSAPEFSHAYFSSGVSSFLFSTHPPLEKRIKRIEPRWDGKYIEPKREVPDEKPKTDVSRRKKEAVVTAVTSAALGTAAAADAVQAVDRIGQPSEIEIDYALTLLAEVPEDIRQEAQDPFGVRALIYCSVIHHSIGIQQRQWEQLEKYADPAVLEKTREFFPRISALPTKLRLPIFELCMPALTSLSKAQYITFKRNIEALIQADQKVDIREWIVQRLIIQQLEEAFGNRKPPVAIHTHIGAVKHELELILSLVSYAEHKDDIEAQYAFQTAIRTIGATALKMVSRQEITIAELDRATDKLERVKPALKPRILKALIACLTVDNKISAGSAEFTRAVASCLGSPMPPIKIQA